MVWDLSRSVPRVFRRPGNPLIELFHFIFNSKCNFWKCCFFIQLPFELPIVLPTVFPIGLPIVLLIGLPIVLPIVLPYETTHGRLFSAATAPSSGQ